jgi:hypothetical protein
MNTQPAPTTARTDRSRAEALRRSLLESEVVAETAELLQVRAGQWYYSLKPQNYFHSWLVDEIAVISVRVDRAERSERRLRDRASLRAEVCWDDDRRSEAEAIGVKLASRPAESVDQLRKTAAGCDWLMRRWALLAYVAEIDGKNEWTPDQARLAFDLLGLPEEVRVGRPGVNIDNKGRVIDPAEGPAEVARRQIDELQVRRDRLARVDEVDRALVMADLFDDPSPEIRRLRRHESALHGRLRWCLAQLKYESPHRKPHPDVTPTWTYQAPPVPEAPPEPAAPPTEAWQFPAPPHAPFDLLPEECPPPGEPIVIPVIIEARRQKRLRAENSRREARRRKLERLRA